MDTPLQEACRTEKPRNLSGAEELRLEREVLRETPQGRILCHSATAISEHDPKTPRAATEIRIAQTAVRHYLPHFGVKSQNKNIENVPA